MDTTFDFYSYYNSLSIKEISDLYREMIKLGVKENHIDAIFMKVYNSKMRKEKLEKLKS